MQYNKQEEEKEEKINKILDNYIKVIDVNTKLIQNTIDHNSKILELATEVDKNTNKTVTEIIKSNNNKNIICTSIVSCVVALAIIILYII